MRARRTFLRVDVTPKPLYGRRIDSRNNELTQNLRQRELSLHNSFGICTFLAEAIIFMLLYLAFVKTFSVFFPSFAETTALRGANHKVVPFVCVDQKHLFFGVSMQFQ